MKANISGQIAHLHQLSREALLDLWQKLYKKAISPGLRREVMIPFLAYRIQEIAYGGLKTTARTELRRVARALEKGTVSEILSRSLRLAKTLLGFVIKSLRRFDFSRCSAKRERCSTLSGSVWARLPVCFAVAAA